MSATPQAIDSDPEFQERLRLVRSENEGTLRRLGVPERWNVELICCGRDDGRLVADSWDAADQLRQEYVNSTSKVLDLLGHERVGIVRRSTDG